MSKRQIIVGILSALIIMGMSRGIYPQKKNAIKPSVTVVPATVKPGGSCAVKVTLKLPSGMHINSYKPEDEFAIPTELKINDAPGLTIAPPQYPPGQKHTYSYAPKGLTVYEGNLELAVPVQVKKEAKPGNYPLKGQLRFQPCDAQVCYPPEKADIAVAIQVK